MYIIIPSKCKIQQSKPAICIYIRGQGKNLKFPITDSSIVETFGKRNGWLRM